jgi:hypothetical protein
VTKQQAALLRAVIRAELLYRRGDSRTRNVWIGRTADTPDGFDPRTARSLNDAGLIWLNSSEAGDLYAELCLIKILPEDYALGTQTEEG